MDLSTLAPIEKKHNITHPATGKETGMILTLACSHDERVKTAQREINDEVIKAGRDIDAEMEKTLDDRLAASYITGVEFTGDATWNGKTPKYSARLAQEICAVPALKDQVYFEVRRTQDFYAA